jgi:hypothetical protein
MPLEDIAELPDPSDQLRADIESAIEGQHKEAPADDVADAAPSSEPSSDAPGDGRERDSQGRFVAKGETADEHAKEDPKEVEEPKSEPSATEAPKTAARPPPGFSIASKAAWDKEAPTAEEWAAAKADIAKREQEVDNGFKRYGGLSKFAEEAERNGRTLQDAVADYVTVEGALKQNFVGGIEFICQKLGVNPRQLVQVMAGKYFPGGQSAQQVDGAPALQQAQPQPQPQPQINPRAIADHVAHVLRQEAELREANGQVNSFKTDPNNKYFENVRQDMFMLVNSGKAATVEEAYEAACWLNPEIRSMMISEANGGRNREAAVAASRSRNAAKAVGGSPTPGVNPDTKDKRRNLSLEEEINAAYDAQVGAA